MVIEISINLYPIRGYFRVVINKVRNNYVGSQHPLSIEAAKRIYSATRKSNFPNPIPDLSKFNVRFEL